MSDNYKVVFITGFPQEAIDAVLTYQPEGFSTTVLRSRETSEEEQVEALRDADFLILYGGRPSENAFRAATRLRLVQLLSAGYDAMDLDLLSELEIRAPQRRRELLVGRGPRRAADAVGLQAAASDLQLCARGALAGPHKHD